ncbi:alpha-N-methyltransferase NTM1 [Russula vinacea]|nr:alpha-N-methyltransferase NTM1 [Russula vinacea]
MASSPSPPQVEEPVLQDSLSYWEKQKATYDGSLPRTESLGSRKFLLYLFPELSTIQSVVRPLKPAPARRFRALDVGAGIGRVTSDTLLHLVSDVVLLEPVESLSVTFLQGTLQGCDPANPLRTAAFLGRVGYIPTSPDDESGFDVVWCQWCLTYMTDADLITFLKRSQAALRKEGPGVIVVKENVCKDGEGGVPDIHFDKEDSSVTRSDLHWKMVFRNAGLSLLHERVQLGLPRGLFMVKM